MHSQNAARGLFIGLLALTLYLMYLIFKPMIPGIAWAVVLVVAFYPLHGRLVRLLRGREWAAAILLSAFVAAFIVVPAVFAVVRAGQGIVQGYQWLEAKQAAGASLADEFEKIPWLVSAKEWAGEFVDLEQIDLQAVALTTLQRVGNALAQRTTGFVANALQTLLTLLVLVVTMAVLFHEGPRLLRLVRQLVPLSEQDKVEAFHQLEVVTRSVFFGVILTALAQAVLGTIGFAIVGLPAPIAFGAAMFFCALLPAGPTIVWGPAAIYLLATGRIWEGVFLVVWGAALVGSADNVLRPIFIGRGLKLHMWLVFFGIFGGMMAFGLIGLFIGPLIITLFLFLLEVAKRDLFRVGEAGA